jgi:hypothetical protein
MMIAMSEDDDNDDGDGATGDEVDDDGDGGCDGRWRDRIRQGQRW